MTPISRMIAAAALACFCIAGLAGCPIPTNFEEFWGYNSFVFYNQGDRPVDAIYLIPPDQPGRGPNYVEIEGGLLPERSLAIDGLPNANYRLEFEYLRTGQETGGDPEIVTVTVQNIELALGDVVQYFWHGPDSD